MRVTLRKCSWLSAQPLSDFLCTHFLNSLAFLPEQAAAPAAKSTGAAPRFEIKKWNAVAMWSWDICADTVCYMLYLFSRVAPVVVVRYYISIQLTLCALYLFSVRHLPKLAERALDRIPSQSISHQRQRSFHCLWKLRTRLSLGLHPALAENSICMPALQQRMGLCQN